MSISDYTKTRVMKGKKAEDEKIKINVEYKEKKENTEFHSRIKHISHRMKKIYYRIIFFTKQTL